MLVLALPSAGVAPFLVKFRSRGFSVAAAAQESSSSCFKLFLDSAVL